MAVSMTIVEQTTLGQIDDDENIRRDLGDIAPLVASIKEHGLLQMPTVRRKEGGRFVLIAGHRRLAALREIAGKRWKKEPIQVSVLVDDDAERDIERRLAENVVRLGMDVFDEADAFKSACERGRTIEDVALAFGVEAVHVRQRLQLANLIQVYRPLVREGRMPLSAARKMAAVPSAEQEAIEQAVMDRAHQAGGISEYDVRNMLRVKRIEVKHALFDVAASGLTVEKDLFDPYDVGTTAEVERFLDLQRAAIEERRAAYLAMGVPFVEVIDRTKGDLRDPKELGVVYWGDGPLPPLHDVPNPDDYRFSEEDEPDDETGDAAFDEAYVSALEAGEEPDEAVNEALEENWADEAAAALQARKEIESIRSTGVVLVLHASGEAHRYRCKPSETIEAATKAEPKAKLPPASFYQLRGDLHRLHAADALARDPKLALAVALVVLTKPSAFTGLSGSRNRVTERMVGREESPAVTTLTARLEVIGRWLDAKPEGGDESDQLWNPERWGGLYSGWGGRNLEAVIDTLQSVDTDEMARALGAVLGTWLDSADLVDLIRKRPGSEDMGRRVVMTGEELRKLPTPIFIEQALAIGFSLRRKATKAENVDSLAKACVSRMRETGEAPVIPLLYGDPKPEETSAPKAESKSTPEGELALEAAE